MTMIRRRRAMTGSAHGGPADDNDVGGVFRVCVGVEESARSAPLMWGVFDEPLTDHDLLVLSRAFDFSDGLREHCVPAAWEALDSTLDSGGARACIASAPDRGRACSGHRGFGSCRRPAGGGWRARSSSVQIAVTLHFDDVAGQSVLRFPGWRMFRPSCGLVGPPAVVGYLL